VNDVRGRPKTTTYGGFQGLPIRQENFSYDALDRVRTLAYPGGRQEIDYDGLATIREVRTDLAGVSLAVKQTPDASGYRQLLEYPSLAVQEVRDPGGRLEELRPQGATPVVSSTSFIAADVIGERALGAGAVRFQTDVDGRKRPRFRRYENASGDVLLDLRYTFDAVDDLVSRQRIDRGGRSDLFRYDEGHRLTRADHGARPSILGQGVRAFAGFQVSPALPGGWAPGLYARETSFDDMDVFTGASTVAPQAVPVPPFAGSYGAVDASLHVGLIDGLSRQRDALGNTGNALLQTRDGAAPAPVATEASLLHDQKSRLVKISRADGAQVENEFDAWGLRTRRTVTCGAAAPGCQPSDRFYLYHKGLLLEEYEGGAGTASLLARYFYDDESDLLAMDRRVAGGGLERFYFLTDIDGSVLGVADAGGRLLERVLYDAWGEPTLELADGASPRVRRITAGPSGDLLVEWTERVLPPIDPGTDPGAPETRYADLASAIVLRSTATGNAVPYSVEYAEAESGFALGTVLRIRPSSPAPSELLLEIAAGAVRDEWNNPVAAVSIPVRSDLAPGTPAFSNPDQGSTAPERVGRSSIGSPFLFHGEYFDYETGLVYLRNRFYQPSTGLFLERDPMPYADSVNAYAGMMNNPVAFKDPSGAGVFDVLKVAGRATARAASAGARAAGRSIRSVGRAAGNLGRGFGRKATALVNRLDRSANRLTAQLDEALNGSYKAAAQTTRRVDSVGPRARQLAADFRAARATSTPEPTAGVQAGTGGRAVALDGPTAQRPPTTLAARSEDFAPLPRPLSQKEVASIQAKNAAFNASNAGQRVLHQAKINRANRAIELHPELEGINPKGCKTNCVASENALGIRKSEGLRSVNADDVETPLKNGDNAFNPRETQFHEFLNVRDVVSRVKAAGPGAHFHVRGIRGQGIVGHRFGVVNHNGAVHFLDPQLESFANLKGQGYVSFWLLRYK
jgi:RHS repeat-associated protein